MGFNSGFKGLMAVNETAHYQTQLKFQTRYQRRDKSVTVFGNYVEITDVSAELLSYIERYNGIIYLTVTAWETLHTDTSLLGPLQEQPY